MGVVGSGGGNGSVLFQSLPAMSALSEYVKYNCGEGGCLGCLGCEQTTTMATSENPFGKSFDRQHTTTAEWQGVVAGLDAIHMIVKKLFNFSIIVFPR